MAIETSVTEAQIAWSKIGGIAHRFISNARQADEILQADDVTLEFIMYQVYRVVLDTKAKFLAEAGTTDLDIYVQDVRNDAGYVATTELASIDAALQAIIDWIDTNASGLSLTGDSAANSMLTGSLVTDRFSAATLAPLRALFVTAVALVN